MRSSTIESLEPRTLFTVFVVDTIADEVTANGSLSLREAINAANTNTAVGDAPAGSATNAKVDVIRFATGLKNQTITLNGATLDILEGVRIVGRNVTIHGGNTVRPVTINTEEQVWLSGLNLTGGSAAQGGGLSATESLVNLHRVNIHNNTAAVDFGGGIHAVNSVLRITQSRIYDNTAAQNGGGIYVDDVGNYGEGTRLINSTVTGNTATAGHGGGIAVMTGPLTILHSRITGNGSSALLGAGGGLYVDYEATVALRNKTVIAENAAALGGGVAVDGGYLYSFDSSISNNNAAGNGTANGGGLYLRGGAELARTKVDRNTSLNGAGGGISFVAGALHMLRGSTLRDNTSHNPTGGSAGGGAYLASSFAAICEFSNVTISGNKALETTSFDSNLGGGIFNLNAEVILNNVRIFNNTAGSGGGVFTEAGAITTVNGGTIRDNAPDNLAGGGTVN